MVRTGFSWKTAVVATFFVSVLGLNLSLSQPSGDIKTKKNSTNFQTIQYGTPKQTYTENTIDTSRDTKVTSHPPIIVQPASPPKTTPPPRQNSCNTCGGYRKVSTTESAQVMCTMIMCSQ